MGDKNAAVEQPTITSAVFASLLASSRLWTPLSTIGAGLQALSPVTNALNKATERGFAR